MDFHEHIENPESIQAVKWAKMSVQLNPQYSNMDLCFNFI